MCEVFGYTFGQGVVWIHATCMVQFSFCGNMHSSYGNFTTRVFTDKISVTALVFAPLPTSTWCSSLKVLHIFCWMKTRFQDSSSTSFPNINWLWCYIKIAIPIVSPQKLYRMQRRVFFQVRGSRPIAHCSAQIINKKAGISLTDFLNFCLWLQMQPVWELPEKPLYDKVERGLMKHRQYRHWAQQYI